MSLPHLEYLTASTDERSGGWPATESLLLALIMLLVVSFLPPYPTSLIVLPVMVVASRLHFETGKRGWNRWWRRIWPFAIIPSAFSALGAFAIGVRLNTELLHWPKWSHLPDWQTQTAALFAGYDTALSVGVLVRSMAGTASIGYLALSVTIGEMASVLRRLGMPAVFAELLVSTIRFASILFDTASAIFRSQLARGGYNTNGTARRSISMLMSTLLLISIDRAQRLEIGLAARAGDGELRTLVKGSKVSPYRLLIIGALAAVIILLSIWIPILERSAGVR